MMAVEMKMKKKRILAFTACLLAAMLCACSREPAGQTPAGTEEAVPQESAAENTETASAQPEAAAENTETASAQPETVAGNAETASPEPETETLTVLEGTLNGWADNHTVEIMVDGVPTAFQVEDEEVKTALEAVPEGTNLSFSMEQDGEVRRIVEVL